jgi:predicted transcriptional regulator
VSRLFSPFRAQHQFLQKYLKFKIALFQLKGHGNFLKEHQRSECLSSFFGAPGAYTSLWTHQKNLLNFVDRPRI